MTEFDEVYKKRDLISYILSVGEARQILDELLEHELFNRGKHDPYWQKEDADKLHEIYCQISYIQSKLYEIDGKLS